MIIGTAGHVDHGKSALVQALTGQSMDRLAEEKRRGITIDLNFAPYPLEEGRLAGIVDVPGHEDLVRTMVAGASGIDVLLLVIAADEGIMPQTREHLAIAEELGLRSGIPVLTKVDLVEPEWLRLVAAEVAEWLRASRVRFGPPIEVSALHGTGLEALHRRLREEGRDAAARDRSDLFRMPVDRSFSVAGIGTVVTGTAWSGSVAIGHRLHIMPSRREVRVRSIESHGRQLTKSEPGERTALGLTGVERTEIGRGDVIVEADAPWPATTALDVEIHLLPDAGRSLGPRSRLRVHLGTAEILARVHPNGAAIAPGATMLARLALEAPTTARGGDRFVLRNYSPVLTIGGGRVLDPVPPRRKAEWPTGLHEGDDARRLGALASRRRAGIARSEVPIILGATPERTQALIEQSREVRLAGQRIFPAALFTELGGEAVARLEVYHRTHPADPGMPLETLRRSLGQAEAAVQLVLDDLVASGAIVTSGGQARLATFLPRVEGGDAIVDRAVAVLAKAGLTPPTVAELNAQFSRTDIAATLRLAAGSGRVVAVERDRYYAAEAIATFVAALREIGGTGAASITPAGLRDRLGITRKFLIPLLEWADATGVTIRVGDARRLK